MEETEKQAEATFVMLFFIMGVGIDFLLLHAPDSKLSSGPAHQSVNGAKSEGGVQVPFLCLGPRHRCVRATVSLSHW